MPCSLRCAVTSLRQHLAPSTPIDIYVFVKEQDLIPHLIPDWLRQPDVLVLPLLTQVRDRSVGWCDVVW